MAASLPIRTLPVVERWDCHNCGNCCRGSIVPLDDADLDRLRKQKWEDREGFRGTPVIHKQGWLQPTYRLAQRSDGSCVFLTEDGLCRVHAEFGIEEKPMVCRTYPLQLIPLEKHAFFTVRRGCPSAACDLGREVTEHRPAIDRAVKAGRGVPHATQPPPVTKAQRRAWGDVLQAAGAIERLITDSRFPLVRRLVHGLQFCDLLEACRLRKLDSEQFAELMNVLEGAATEDAGRWFRDRQPAGRATATLFRQTVAEYLRLHPEFRPGKGWAERWRLTLAAVAFARGRGLVPPMHGNSPKLTFEELESRQFGPLGDETLEPLTRYFETSTMSRSYAILDRQGWPLVDSFRALAITYAVILWMLRFASGDKAPTQQHVLDVLTAVDRGQGYAPLAANRHRRRVHTIGTLGELPQLIAWYAR